MSISNSLINHFLVAMPTMQDPRFARSVSLVCQHNEDGAVALILNKPISQTLADTFEHLNLPTDHLGNPEQAILYGGPVQPETGFILHQDKGDWQATLTIDEQLYLTSSSDILEAISRNEGPQQYLFFLGYAGWSGGQIEDEMQDNAWFHISAQSGLIFNTPSDSIASAVLNEAGIDLTTISSQVGHA